MSEYRDKTLTEKKIHIGYIWGTNMFSVLIHIHNAPLLFLFLSVLRVKLTILTLYMLDKYCSSELHPQFQSS